MQIFVETEASAVALRAAGLVAGYMKEHPGKLICLSAGEATTELYGLLAEMHLGGQIDLNRMYYVLLNEWSGLDADTPGSCTCLLRESFFSIAGLDPARCLWWNGKTENSADECKRMRRGVRERGGIGLAILGVDKSGRLGFNLPGTPADISCHEAELDDAVWTAFPNREDRVPGKGLTLGLSQLLDSEQILLLAQGLEKATIMRKTLIEEPTLQSPGSLLQSHEAVQVVMDRELLAAL